MSNRIRPPAPALLAPLVFLAALSAGTCGGGPSAPSPVNSRWTLSLLVTTSADQPVAGAALRIVDGPNQGHTATTDAAGRGVLTDLLQGGFTVEVTADLFTPASVPVTLTSNLTLTVRMSVRPVTNEPPRILALKAGNNRAEEDQEIDVVATVEDTETPPDQLQYEWAAAKGTFTGTGPAVKWRAPKGGKTPDTCELTLTVVEKYTALDANGRLETRENRTPGAVTVHVNDSTGEVYDLVMTFLDDFSHYTVSPETCVRNFSDSCAGKAAELEDIRENRRTRQIETGTFRVEEILFDDFKTHAWVSAPCEFRSLLKDASGVPTSTVEVAKGTCLLEAVFEDWHWWLCDSKFKGVATSGLRFVF